MTDYQEKRVKINGLKLCTKCNNQAFIYFRTAFNDIAYIEIKCRNCDNSLRSETLYYQSVESENKSKRLEPIYKNNLIKKWNDE